MKPEDPKERLLEALLDLNRLGKMADQMAIQVRAIRREVRLLETKIRTWCFRRDGK